MADRRMLGAMAGLAQGLDKGATNLQNIMKASYDIKQNKELLNLKKKAIEADITQNAWERDYKSQLLKSELAKNAVDEKTAMREGYKTREEIRGLKQKYDFVSNINAEIVKQISPQGNDGKLPVEKLGWSVNTGTGTGTISNRRAIGSDMDFLDEEEVSGGGKPVTQPQPNRQVQIDKARQAGYTDEQISAYLKGL